MTVCDNCASSSDTVACAAATDARCTLRVSAVDPALSKVSLLSAAFKAIKDWEKAIELNPDYKNKLQMWIDETKEKLKKQKLK